MCPLMTLITACRNLGAEALRIQEKDIKGRQTELYLCISRDLPGTPTFQINMVISLTELGFRNINFK